MEQNTPVDTTVVPSTQPESSSVPPNSTSDSSTTYEPQSQTHVQSNENLHDQNSANVIQNPIPQESKENDNVKSAADSVQHEPAPAPVHDPTPTHTTPTVEPTPAVPASVSAPPPASSSPKSRQQIPDPRQQEIHNMIGYIQIEMEEERKKNEATFLQKQKASEQQKELLNKIVNRVKIGAQTCQTLNKYFTERANITTKYIKSLADLPKIHGLGETGTTDSGLDYIERVAKSEVESMDQFCTAVTGHICKQFGTMVSDMNAHYKKLGSHQQSLCKELDQSFERVMKTYMQLEKASKECHDTLLAKPHEGLAYDPWIERIAYCDALKQLAATQTSFNKQLELVYQQVEKIDAKRIESIRSALKEYVLVHKNATQKIAKDVHIAGTVLESIKEEYDFAVFTQEEGLRTQNKLFIDNLPHIEPPISNETNVLEYANRSVLRVGELEVSGLVRWKKHIFVLTRYGFLHYFASRDKTEPEVTIPLLHTSLTLTEPAKNTFQLVYTPNSFFSSTKTYTLRALDEAQMVDWLIDLKRFVKKQQ